MNRHILTPPVLTPSALAELKQWLGITTAHDDAPLAALIATSLDVCEGFTGQMPLAASCEELLPACGGWQALATRPVQAIAGLSRIAADGTLTALATGDYETDLGPDGTGRVRLLQPALPGRLVVSFTAGLVPEWEDLPDSLRHGLIRLAAHQHRQRESGGGAILPPASVAALWRPWRRLRIA
ncbi:hypothetical protein [Novosphingobium colocasiae]|uniref:head-tail connector protein n=1 Tax=Novosphingobium colocasiae TaxID=1256513 RepID=UPI0035B14AD8